MSASWITLFLLGSFRCSPAVRYKRTSLRRPASSKLGGGTFWDLESQLNPKLFMIVKHLLRAERLRQVPAGFGWVDHRLVRNGFISRCDHAGLALYLFLVTVA